MTFALGSRSLARCKQVDSRLIAVVELALSYGIQDGGFAAEQSRTPAEEAALVKAGRSHTMFSRHIIGAPHAAPGASGAVDLVPWINGAFVWDWPSCAALAFAMRRAGIASDISLTWGGVWDRRLADLGVSDSADMLAASNAYAAREHAAGNPHPLLDGPHFQIEQDP